MRGFVAALAATGALFGAVAAASAQSTATAQRSLGRAMRAGLRAAGGRDGVEVVDMTTGQTLFSSAPSVPRLPASVEKVYTTSTALLRFGPDTRLSTRVLGVGTFDLGGGFHGTLYLKGGGDPTFGSKSFDRSAYGTGATMQQLVGNLIRATGITSFSGRIVGDESYFDSLRGTPPYGDHASSWIEGELSALVYNRGLANPQGSAFQRRPALFATQQFVSALKVAGVHVPSKTRVYTGVTPASAKQLAVVHSPRMSWLIRLTNTPSDNFFAEMLLKGLGASFGGAGTTAAGAAVVSSEMATFGVHPELNDGSGLSRSDFTTPRQVVTVLERMAGNPNFTDSLAIGGETGTLQDEMRGTAAQGKCIGKTGTLHDVANLVGYCTARDGHKLVFAFLMNSQASPDYGHEVEANMAVALAKYDG
jgi:D-alanyl-D-alanine carboxypeptidase/D-alanyl-D-alanine-endopeptidase (penicillin-binding protein 4)